MRKQQSEILLQSAVDGVLQRERHDARNKLGGHAARERAHSTRAGNGLAWISRTDCCLSLRKRYRCSTNQYSRKQENTVAFVSEPQRSLLGLDFYGGGAGRQYPSLARVF